MLKNSIKQRLQQGEVVLGTWLIELRSTALPQLLAQAGLDFLVVDMEHGPFNLESVADIMRMARQVSGPQGAPITPLVRIPELSYERVAPLLDAGAQGLILPRVEEAAQALAFIDYMKYPPAGQRGMASGVGNTDFKWVDTEAYRNFANDEILAVVQIETKRGLDNVADLATVAGLDVILIGPEDLSISLGYPGQREHPAVLAAIDEIVAAAGRQGIAAGIHTGDLAALPAHRERGIHFITYASDIEFIYSGAAQGVAALRRGGS